jgi:hypothetical protein
MNFDVETAIITLMGEAFVDNNLGIMKDLYALDAGFNAVFLGLHTVQLRKTRLLELANKSCNE